MCVWNLGSQKKLAAYQLIDKVNQQTINELIDHLHPSPAWS